MPLFNLLHSKNNIQRNTSERMANQAENQRISCEFGQAYFDGPREHGYGGYYYDGRWQAVADRAIKHYGLTAGQRVLDIGAAKGFFVYDLRHHDTKIDACGLDISAYALENAHPGIASWLQLGNAKSLPYKDNSFDAVFAINILHNLNREDCIQALKEINRVCKKPEKCFVQVDAYQSPEEKALFESWVLTAKTYGTPEDWQLIFQDAGYRGDYYWTIMKIEEQTKEQQYNICLDNYTQQPEQLGIMSSFSWYDDPKRFVFTLSRYKFVAKMFSQRNHVLEVGCSDAFASRLVAQEVEHLTVTDFDPVFIEDAKKQRRGQWDFDCQVHNLLEKPMDKTFDAIYALDVLEHIHPDEEAHFMRNLLASLDKDGAVLLGMPSLESQHYASALSKEGHINCQSMPEFKTMMQSYFSNVFMFSMNDEVVHTGYHKMAHYLFALGCGKRENYD